MKTPDVLPFDPAQKRSCLRAAREAGVLAYDSLDRLLVDACETPQQMASLLRSLKGVLIIDAASADDVLFEHIDANAQATSWQGDDYRLYAQQVRSLRRLTRAEETLIARRLEFARARLRQVVDRSGLPEEDRERILDRGVNCDELRSVVARNRLDDLDLTDPVDDSLGLEDTDRALFPDGFPCDSHDPVVRNSVREYGRLRQHFVERNLYLVIGMSSNYRTYGLPVMDLIQEGNSFLIRAVEKFDFRKKVRFQTYATLWIKQGMERMITANRGIVRVPNYIQQKMRRFRREGKLPRNHKDMDVSEVSELFQVSPESAARLMETDRSWFSLDVPLGGDDNDSFAAVLEAEDSESGMVATEQADLGHALQDVMKRLLSTQEQDIISKRYGLGGGDTMTLDEIGREIGVSRERVRQMQVKAIGKLNTRGLLDELGVFL